MKSYIDRRARFPMYIEAAIFHFSPSPDFIGCVKEPHGNCFNRTQRVHQMETRQGHLAQRVLAPPARGEREITILPQKRANAEENESR